jgi:hypothetical protein
VLRSDGERSHQLRAELVGTLDGGEFRGRMVEIAPSMGPEPDGLWHLEYDVIGGYARGSDGVLRFQAQLFLDLSPLGLPGSLLAGGMRGTLQTADLSPSFQPCPGGFCPGPMSPYPTAPYQSWPDGNSTLRSSGGALKLKGKTSASRSGSDARSSVGKHASGRLRSESGEPQMQRAATPSAGRFDRGRKGTGRKVALHALRIVRDRNGKASKRSRNRQAERQGSPGPEPTA